MTTDEATNMAICEALGHTYHRPTEAEIKSGSYYQYEPKYTTSRDACAEFEATLTDSDAGTGSRWRYIQELIEEAGAESMEIHREVFVVATAKPRARCAAFVKTMGLEARIKELESL